MNERIARLKTRKARMSFIEKRMWDRMESLVLRKTWV